MTVDSLESSHVHAVQSRPIRERPRMSETETPPTRAEVYDDMKRRLGVLGLRIEDFGEFLGVARTTIPKWRAAGTPPYALNILHVLETYRVPEAWKLSRTRPAATKADALDAIRPAAIAVVDDAIAKGWSREQIGHALRTIADETDPRRS